MKYFITDQTTYWEQILSKTLELIYNDKNNNKFKNKLVKAFRNMHLQYYSDIHKFS